MICADVLDPSERVGFHAGDVVGPIQSVISNSKNTINEYISIALIHSEILDRLFQKYRSIFICKLVYVDMAKAVDYLQIYNMYIFTHTLFKCFVQVYMTEKLGVDSFLSLSVKLIWRGFAIYQQKRCMHISATHCPSINWATSFKVQLTVSLYFERPLSRFSSRSSFTHTEISSSGAPNVDKLWHSLNGRVLPIFTWFFCVYLMWCNRVNIWFLELEKESPNDHYCNDVPWASWGIKSPPTQPFISQLVQANNDNNKNHSSASLAFCEWNPPVTDGRPLQSSDQ